MNLQSMKPLWLFSVCALVFLGSACSGGSNNLDAQPGSGGSGGDQSGSGSTVGSGGDDAGDGGGSGASPGSGGGPDGSGGLQASGGSILGSDEEYPIPDSLPEETGAELWLRYREVPIPLRLAEYQAAFTHVVGGGGSATLAAAAEELVLGLSGLTGASVASAAEVQGAGAVLIGTPQSSSVIAGLPLEAALA